MAKKISEDSPKAGHNGFDPKVLRSCVERIENLKEEIASVRAKAMAECKAFGDDINDVLEEAKARGIPRKELKNAIKARELTRKIEALREDLDMVGRDTYDQIRHALGDLADTPLGAAAMEGAPGAPDDDDRDLRPRHLQQNEADRKAAAEESAGEANGAALAAGIKPLKPKNGGAEAGAH